MFWLEYVFVSLPSCLTLRCFCSIAQTDMTSRPPILRTRANSFNACTLLSVVAKWCTTAIDSTASKLSSRNGSAKLSQIRTLNRITWVEVVYGNLQSV